MFRDYLAFASVGMEPNAPFEEAPSEELANTFAPNFDGSGVLESGFSRTEAASTTTVHHTNRDCGLSLAVGCCAGRLLVDECMTGW